MAQADFPVDVDLGWDRYRSFGHFFGRFAVLLGPFVPHASFGLVSDPKAAACPDAGCRCDRAL